MHKKSLLTLLCCMYLVPSMQAVDTEFFTDMEESLRKMSERMERRMSSFFDNNDLDTTLNAVQKRIDKMREHFDHMQEKLAEHYESLTNSLQEKSTHTPLLTIKDEDTLVRIVVHIGSIETDMIENHLEDNTLVISIPKNKPLLKIFLEPNTVTVIGNKIIEKEETEKDTKTSSHIITSNRIHFQQTLPSTIITTENVNIIHSADEKTLTIELPKKTHKQQFSIKKQ